MTEPPTTTTTTGTSAGTTRPLTRPEAMYRQLADALREAIRAGDFTPGQALPSEAALQRRYGVSRPTIRLAISELRAAGLVSVEHGRGTFVRSTPARTLRQRHAWVPGNPGQVAKEATPIDAPVLTYGQPPADIAALLGIDADTTVIIREWTTEPVAGTPELHTSYLPADTPAGNAEDPEASPDAIYGELATTTGPLHFTERVAARMPTPEETTALDLPAGTPLLRTLRLCHNNTGHTIEIHETRMRADATELTYNLTPPEQT